MRLLHNHKVGLGGSDLSILHRCNRNARSVELVWNNVHTTWNWAHIFPRGGFYVQYATLWVVFYISIVRINSTSLVLAYCKFHEIPQNAAFNSSIIWSNDRGKLAIKKGNIEKPKVVQVRTSNAVRLSHQIVFRGDGSCGVCSHVRSVQIRTLRQFHCLPRHVIIHRVSITAVAI